jgi:hypothetical protein
MFRPLIAVASLLGFAAPTARESRSAGAIITNRSRGGAFGSSKLTNETDAPQRPKWKRKREGSARIVTGYRFRTNSIRHVY